MVLIADDPIIRSIERTGYPFWMPEEDEPEEEDEEWTEE